MSLAMTKEEREAFLADVHIAVISIPEADRGPLTAPVWYAYEPGGEEVIWTGGASRKARLLQQSPNTAQSDYACCDRVGNKRAAH